MSQKHQPDSSSGPSKSWASWESSLWDTHIILHLSGKWRGWNLTSHSLTRLIYLKFTAEGHFMNCISCHVIWTRQSQHWALMRWHFTESAVQVLRANFRATLNDQSIGKVDPNYYGTNYNKLIYLQQSDLNIVAFGPLYSKFYQWVTSPPKCVDQSQPTTSLHWWQWSESRLWQRQNQSDAIKQKRDAS